MTGDARDKAARVREIELPQSAGGEVSHPEHVLKARRGLDLPPRFAAEFAATVASAWPRRRRAERIWALFESGISRRRPIPLRRLCGEAGGQKGWRPSGDRHDHQPAASRAQDQGRGQRSPRWLSSLRWRRRPGWHSILPIIASTSSAPAPMPMSRPMWRSGRRQDGLWRRHRQEHGGSLAQGGGFERQPGAEERVDSAGGLC